MDYHWKWNKNIYIKKIELDQEKDVWVEIPINNWNMGENMGDVTPWT